MIKNKRIEVVDALRGFAILCILLLHSSNHFLYDVMPENNSTWLKALNASTKQMLYFLFEGKAFGIFAILFGFTFGIQYYKALERGNDFRFCFLWRMVLLAGFGYINAAFFAGGDPLVFMAIVAIVLPLTARWGTKNLILSAVILSLQPLELYKTVVICLDPDHITTGHTGPLYALLQPKVAEGNFVEMAWNNITIGIKACLTWAFEHGRISQTPALYIVGFLFYKHRLFTNINKHFWEKLTIVTLITTPILYMVKSITKVYSTTLAPIHIATTMWYNLSFIFLFIALFILLYRTDVLKQFTGVFQTYGKMSLTNFVFQSILGSFLFYPFGLHLSTHCGIVMSVLIGITIAVFQIILSYWWLSKHKRGPLNIYGTKPPT